MKFNNDNNTVKGHVKIIELYINPIYFLRISHLL